MALTCLKSDDKEYPEISQISEDIVKEQSISKIMKILMITDTLQCKS